MGKGAISCHTRVGKLVLNLERITFKYVAPFTLRVLLYGDDNLDLAENKRIIAETLRFMNDSKRFA